MTCSFSQPEPLHSIEAQGKGRGEAGRRQASRGTVDRPCARRPSAPSPRERIRIRAPLALQICGQPREIQESNPEMSRKQTEGSKLDGRRPGREGGFFSFGRVPFHLLLPFLDPENLRVGGIRETCLEQRDEKGQEREARQEGGKRRGKGRGKKRKAPTAGSRRALILDLPRDPETFRASIVIISSTLSNDPLDREPMHDP